MVVLFIIGATWNGKMFQTVFQYYSACLALYI